MQMTSEHAQTSTLEPSPPFAVGVDLGGTKLEAVLMRLPEKPLSDPSVEPQRLVLERVRVPTEAHRGYEHILGRLTEVVQGLLLHVPESQRGATRVGVGLPGHISRRTGKVKNANTTCLNGRDLWNDFRHSLGRPVAFDNDANCLTLAEATWGGARDAQGLVFGVILGTGVGGGLALPDSRTGEKQVWSGRQGIGGEWGHNVLEAGRPCYCGKNGCVETWLSGPGLERSLLEAGLRDEHGQPLTARAFNQHLQQLEETGVRPSTVEQSVLDAHVERFGRAMSVVINILDPDVIVMGGGMSRLSVLYSAGPAAVKRYVFNDELLTRIVPATLGDAAGVYGAALIGVSQGRA